MRRNTLAMLALLPALALGLQGCGGGDDGGTGASKKASDEAKMRKFAQCMRDNGVDMQDPKDGRVEIRASAKPGSGPARTDPKIEAAQKKCAHLMPNGGKPRRPSAADLAKMRAYSKCMRDNGVTAFPDPKPDGGMQLRVGEGTGIDPQSQTFKNADEACKKYQPGGGKGPRFSSGGGK